MTDAELHLRQHSCRGPGACWLAGKVEIRRYTDGNTARQVTNLKK